LLAAQQKLAAAGPERPIRVTFEPAVPVGQIAPEQRYRVAMPVGLLSPFGRTTMINPRSQRRTDVMVDDAIARFLVRP